MRSFPKPDNVFLDGCAILWVVTWPKSGTPHDDKTNKCRIKHAAEWNMMYLI